MSVYWLIKEQEIVNNHHVMLHMVGLFSDIDECQSSPCHNGGVCNNLQAHYTCSCAAGWEGTNCQIGTPDSKVHGANMGPICDRQDPGGTHAGHVNLAIWDITFHKVPCKQAVVCLNLPGIGPLLKASNR